MQQNHNYTKSEQGSEQHEKTLKQPLFQEKSEKSADRAAKSGKTYVSDRNVFDENASDELNNIFNLSQCILTSEINFSMFFNII